MSIIERIITVYNDKGSKQALKDLKKLEKQFAAAGKKIAKAFAVATVATAAFAVKVGVDAVKAAMEDQKSQALLANTLRNTVGATDAAIASVEDYITKQQKLFSVADDKLRPSLAALTAATMSITEAQKLQNVALDIAADRNIDLESASALLAKGYNGNLTALKKLYPQISNTIVKTKDFNAALTLVAATSKGAAAKAADSLAGRLEGLKLAYGEVLETLGYALIPVIQDFVKYIQNDILPLLDAWMSANKDKVATSLKNILDMLLDVSKAVFNFFDFISRNIETLKVFGAILVGLFVGTKVLLGIQAVTAAVTLLAAAFAGTSAASVTTALAVGAITAGASLLAGAAAAVIFLKVVNDATKSTLKLGNSTETVLDKFNAYKESLRKAIPIVTKLNKTQLDAAKKSALDAKDAAKKLAERIQAETVLAQLKKLGVTTKEADAIQLEAARQNLVKQGQRLDAEKELAILAVMEAQFRLNETTQRYSDLLQVLADQKISSEEVAILSAKWGITRDQVLLYITSIYAVADAKISDDEINALAMSWGITRLQASQYLDFFKALNDGKLDATEIENLRLKWGLTILQVQDYAKKVSAGTAISPSWSLPGMDAADGWDKALEAFNKYQKALGNKVTVTGGGITTTTTTNAAGDAAAKAAADAKAKADAEAAAKAASDLAAAAAAAAAAATAAAAAGAATQAGAVIRAIPGMGAVSRGEYSASNIPTLSPTAADFGDSGRRGNNYYVTVNNAGSTISSGDLTQQIRNELLGLQSNGQVSSRFQTLAI